MVFSSLDYLRLIADILALATGICLLFISLVSSGRKSVNYHFAAFATVFLAYSLLHVVGGIFPSKLLFSPHLHLNALILMLALLASTYYLFVAYFVGVSQRALAGFTVLILLFAVLGIPLLRTNTILNNFSSDFSNFEYAMFAYLLFGIGILSTLLALWAVLSKQSKSAKLLRFPSVSFFLAYSLRLLIGDTTIIMFLLTFAALWTASVFIRRQIFSPLESLNTKLQTANDELRHNNNELIREKERVEQLNRELIDANRYKDEFFANVSHELRTPLNSIIGYSELLMSPVYGVLNKQQEERLGRIYRNGMNLAELIEAVLDLNALESAQLILDIKEFDIHPIINQTLGRVKPFADEKNLSIQTAIPEKLPPIQGDAKRIQQIIYNLLENAVKFTQEGLVKLQIQVINIQWGVSSTFSLPADGWLPDGRWLLIMVSDTGIGIPTESLEYIFSNFMQMDTALNRQYSGLGIGLPISKRLVELHSGIIWVESALDVGSTFYVALPISLPE